MLVAATWVDWIEVLLVGFGSRAGATETTAVFSGLDHPGGAATVTWTSTVAPEGTVPNSQLTMPRASPHDPWDVVTDWNVELTGIVSVSVAADALGPRLVTMTW